MGAWRADCALENGLSLLALHPRGLPAAGMACSVSPYRGGKAGRGIGMVSTEGMGFGPQPLPVSVLQFRVPRWVPQQPHPLPPPDPVPSWGQAPGRSASGPKSAQQAPRCGAGQNTPWHLAMRPGTPSSVLSSGTPWVASLFSAAMLDSNAQDLTLCSPVRDTCVHRPSAHAGSALKVWAMCLREQLPPSQPGA